MGGTVITLRRMELDDLPVVAEMESKLQPKPWSESTFREELARSDRIYLVAEDDVLCGFAGVMVIGDEAHVTNLLVDESSRRRGIGRRLLQELQTEAIAQGAKHLTLEVRASNLAAVALYSAMGMAPVGVRPRYYGDEDALIFWAHDIDEEGTK